MGQTPFLHTIVFERGRDGRFEACAPPERARAPMNRVDIEVPRQPEACDLLFDWQLDIERLARQTQAAVDRRQSDQWVLADAECTLDLIEAELVAARGNRKAGAEAAAITIVRLERWHAQVAGLIAALQSLPD